MRTKTIKAILTKKHNELVASIKDENVRKLVKENSIITGGCFVSMLLNQPVKDYDYYFTNRETALAVAHYYVNEFNAAHPDRLVKAQVREDGFRVKIFIQSQGIAYDSELLDSQPYFDNGNRTDEVDLDLEETLQAITEDKGDYRPVFLSANAITLSKRVQIVIRFYGDPDEIHKNYDFVHCTNYWVSKDGRLVLRPEALEAILTKELRYVGSKYPLCSIIRTRKFVQRGWIINAGQYLKMALQLNDLDLHDINVLEEQLLGVDAYYFQQILELVRAKLEDDPTKQIDTNYLVTIIDRIF